MGLLNKEALLAVASTIKRPYQDVEVTAFGGSVRVMGLTVGERTRYEADIVTGKGRDKDVNVRVMREKLLQKCLVNEDFTTMFSAEEAKVIADLPASIVEPLFDLARKLSGMTDKDVAELGNA